MRLNTKFFSELKVLLNSMFPDTHSLIIKGDNSPDPLEFDIRSSMVNSKHTRFEIYQTRNPNTKFSILLHFPEIRITNSVEDVHIIYDYIVKIKFNFQKLNDDEYFLNYTSLLGKVMSVNTFNAVNNGYMHSHQRSNTEREFDGFCIGQTSLGHLLNKNDNTRITSENLESVIDYISMLLVEIEEYLKWESLEGGPYLTIADHVLKHSHRTGNTFIFKDLHRQMVSYIKETGKQPLKIKEEGKVHLCSDFLENYYTAKIGYIKGTRFKFFGCDPQDFIETIYKKANQNVRAIPRENSVYNIGKNKIKSRHIKVEITESDVEFTTVDSIKPKLEKLLTNVYKKQIIKLLSVPEEAISSINHPGSRALASFRRIV